MVENNYIGYDKVMKDALVENRGKSVNAIKEDKVLVLERRLETEKLSNAAIAEIRKQIKQLRSN